MSSNVKDKNYSAIATFVCFIVVQTAGMVWLISSMNTKIEYASSELRDIKTFMHNAYTHEDAKKDNDLVFLMFKSLTQRVEILEAKASK